MYYRRKIILSLLQQLGGWVSKTDFQKLLFLFVQLQPDKSFDFVPYKYGCFSFQSYADKRAMIHYGLLSDEEGWNIQTQDDYRASLREEDRALLDTFQMRYGHLRGRKLLIHVYANYPYYAINSQIADKILPPEKRAEVEQWKRGPDTDELFTLGYEGLSLDGYLNRLVSNRISLVCDIRKNPVSMKYGFSKNQLQDALSKMGIAYIHMPELGIDSSKRKNLESPEDYERLFREYEREVIPRQTEALDRIRELVGQRHRISLTCFERTAAKCHRGRVTDALSSLIGWPYPITHLS